MIQLLGATPVFVDIDPKTFTIDPEALAGLGHNHKTARLRPKGIMVVDLFGQPADNDRINALARERGLFVLEDAAQSFYPLPLHLRDALRHLGFQPGQFPLSEQAAGRILSLPMHPYLTPENQQLIVTRLME